MVDYQVAKSYGKNVMERDLHKGAMLQTESGRYGVPVEIVMPMSKIKFLDQMISCPADPDAYLRMVYGNYTEIDDQWHK